MFTGCRQAAVPGPKWVGSCELLHLVGWGARSQRCVVACAQCCSQRTFHGKYDFISVQTSLHSEPKATVAFEAVHYHRWLTLETNSFVSLQRCERCSQHGATVGCCLSSCQSNYHFMCARASHCVFQSDKKVYCYKHRDLISNKVLCRVKSFTFLHPQACILSIKKNDFLFYRWWMDLRFSDEFM